MAAQGKGLLHVKPLSSTSSNTSLLINGSGPKDGLAPKEGSQSSSVLSGPPQASPESDQPQISKLKASSTDANVSNRLDNGVLRGSAAATPLGGDLSESPSELSRDRDPFTEANNTPNGSVTSNSLMSPLPQTKSASPSAQLNSTLTSATSSHRAHSGPQPLLGVVRPRSSIPSHLPSSVYAQQCSTAAYASRLNPYALHKGELALLENHLCHLHTTIYLNIRNGILRLWTRNPMVSVTEEEALGCAKDARWVGLASVAYAWLVRNGYINFGCVDILRAPSTARRGRRSNGPTIVIVGAGMAGLGCARQLQALFHHYDDHLGNAKVILLEGRKRIGGRIYSHPLQSLTSDQLPHGTRPTAEMGAQIIVGFDHGNPLDPVVRAQLALRYHLLRDISTLYDVDGSPVDRIQDSMTEKLYNDILDRTGTYRHQTTVAPTAEGDRELIDAGRDSFLDDGITIKQYADAAASGDIAQLLPTKRVRKGVGHKTADIDPPVGTPLSSLAETKEHSAALASQAMGWKWRDGVSNEDTLLLDKVAGASETQSLGAVMDEGVTQYQKLLPLTPKDMRLINWHFANLEYANASPASKLSLSGWDQDVGNEFEGEHAQVIGGYQQVPRGLWSFPTKLDVRTNKTVTKIAYDSQDVSTHKAHVHCEDGQVIPADKVIVTTPLGVLKKRAVNFAPDLPNWKTDAIDRLGFGVMNKVVLVFEKPFWDVERDMFGLLRESSQVADSLSQADYAAGRGRFYLFWNCMKTSGLPVLVALIAGDAAHEVEAQSDDEILGEVTSQLRNVFSDVAVPDPLESIITRWGQDKFAYGSYSNVAADARPGHYDLMAKSVGNLYFAGEATCGTHPATVHGAYLSGLRAASEVLESLIGPIKLPTPLVPPKTKTTNGTQAATMPPPAPVAATQVAGQKRKAPGSNGLAQQVSRSPNQPASTAERKKPSFEDSIREAYEQAAWDVIIGELGPAEAPPRKLALNPFLFYQKDYWITAKNRSDDAHRTASGNQDARAGRNEVRQTLGAMWRDASQDVKKPYLDQVALHRQQNADALAKWKERNSAWEKKTYEVKARWCTENPFESFKEEALKKIEGG